MPENRVRLDERDLARTDDGGTYTDHYQAVTDYQSDVRYRNDHPEKGSSAIANALVLPPGRVRTRHEGGKPDALRRIETAQERG